MNSTMDSNTSNVCSLGIMDLLLKLCKSILQQTVHSERSDGGFMSFLERPSQFHLPWVEELALCRKLRRKCLDILLLRQWEWLSQEKEVARSPCFYAMVHVLHLQQQQQLEAASRLLKILDTLVHRQPGLSETHSVLHFLHLLSLKCCKVVVPQKPKDWIYDIYSSDVFEELSLEKCTWDRSNAAGEIFKHRPGSEFKWFSSGYSNSLTTDSGYGEGSMLGALVRSSSADLHDVLSLPPLPPVNTRWSFLPYKISSPFQSQLVSGDPALLSDDLELEKRMKTLRETVECIDETQMQRGWEGWATDHTYFCDTTPPAPYHLEACLTSMYSAYVMPEEEEEEFRVCSSSEQLLRILDAASRSTGLAVAEADVVRFSINRSLDMLMGACRSKLLLLADPAVSLLEKELASNFFAPVVRWVMDITRHTAVMQKYVLLEYLYSQSSRLQGSAHYLLFLSLLAQAMRTLFKTVQDWIFQGQLDNSQYIGIVSDPQALRERNEVYWKCGYVCSDQVLPSFLSHLVSAVLSCGKALNLMRLCQPRHYLCTGMCPPPALGICFSSQQLLQVRQQCSLYHDQISAYNQTLQDQLSQKRLAEEEAEMAVLVQARQEARRKHDALRRLEAEQLQIEATRKRALALEQKAEMENFRALRAHRLAEERRADQERILAADRRAGLVLEERMLLESEAKQEIEMYYKDLYREAEERRVRAQWRLARLKLASSRQALWRSEKMEWQEAMSRRKVDSEGNRTSKKLAEVSLMSQVNEASSSAVSVPHIYLTSIVEEVKVGNDDVTSEEIARIQNQVSDEDIVVDGAAGTSKAEHRVSKTTVNQSGFLPFDDHPRSSSPSQTLLSTATSTAQALLYPGQDPSVDHVSQPSTTRGTPPPSTAQALLYPGQDPSVDHVSQPSTTRGTPPPSTAQALLYPGQDPSVDHVSQPSTTRGTAPPSTAQALLYPGQDPSVDHVSQPSTTRGTAPPSTAQTLLYPGQDPSVDHVSQPSTTRGTPPPSTAQTLLYPGQDPSVDHVSQPSTTRGTAPPSTAQALLYPGQDPSVDHVSQPSTTRGTAPPSTAQTLLYPGQDPSVDHVSQPSTRGIAPPSTAQTLLYPGQDPSVDHMSHPSTRGVAPPPTIQEVLYPQDLAKDYNSQLTTRGVPPHSTVQHLLYPSSQDRLELPQISSASSVSYLSSQISLEDPFSVSSMPSYQYLDKYPNFDGVLLKMCASIVDSTQTGKDKEIDRDFLSVYPITSLMADSIELPLLTQTNLVQEVLLDHFIHQCQLQKHFLAVKRFLLLEDGEFGHALSTKLCGELSSGRDWRVLYSPSFLRSLLVSSVEASINRDSVDVTCLHLSTRGEPKPIHPNAIRALNYLELKYTVKWPCNIIIPESSIDTCNKILHFLLEMKRSVWVLNSAFHCLKNCSVLDTFQVRRLQIMRHELQHFISTMHGYIASQLFGVTWGEFMTDINEHVRTIDHAIKAHRKFVERGIFRCLLSKRAMPVMKYVYNLLGYILQFSSLVSSISLSPHPNQVFQAIHQVHEDFTYNVKFVIEVLAQLKLRGYQPHLEELLLRLNFNNFY